MKNFVIWRIDNDKYHQIIHGDLSNKVLHIFINSYLRKINYTIWYLGEF